jgi:hypothetical protein
MASTLGKKKKAPVKVDILPVEEVEEVVEEVVEEQEEEAVEEVEETVEEAVVEEAPVEAVDFEHPDFDWTNESLWKDNPEAIQYWLRFKT